LGKRRLQADSLAKGGATMKTDSVPSFSDPLAVGAKEAARLCGISSRSWWRLVAMGKAPPSHKILSRRVWRVADLHRWADNGFVLGGDER